MTLQAINENQKGVNRSLRDIALTLQERSESLMKLIILIEGGCPLERKEPEPEPSAKKAMQHSIMSDIANQFESSDEMIKDLTIESKIIDERIGKLYSLLISDKVQDSNDYTNTLIKGECKSPILWEKQ